jgi:DNA-directed RNA polymerase beta subunit
VQIDPEQQIDTKDSWDIIDSYFKRNGLVKQQIQSFETFLRNDVQKVINEFKENIVKKER